MGDYFKFIVSHQESGKVREYNIPLGPGQTDKQKKKLKELLPQVIEALDSENRVLILSTKPVTSVKELILNKLLIKVKALKTGKLEVEKYKDNNWVRLLSPPTKPPEEEEEKKQKPNKPTPKKKKKEEPKDRLAAIEIEEEEEEEEEEPKVKEKVLAKGKRPVSRAKPKVDVGEKQPPKQIRLVHRGKRVREEKEDDEDEDDAEKDEEEEEISSAQPAKKQKKERKRASSKGKDALKSLDLAQYGADDTDGAVMLEKAKKTTSKKKKVPKQQEKEEEEEDMEEVIFDVTEDAGKMVCSNCHCHFTNCDCPGAM